LASIKFRLKRYEAKLKNKTRADSTEIIARSPEFGRSIDNILKAKIEVENKMNIHREVKIFL